MRKLKNIIQIDEEKCKGCGQCILDCAEGALQLVEGKAKLVGEIYCDGLGVCLSGCPTGALQVTQRATDDFDDKGGRGGSLALSGAQPAHSHGHHHHGPQGGPHFPHAVGCPGSAAMTLAPAAAAPSASHLGHWPIKRQLLNPAALFLKNADLTLLADCAAASLPDLHASLLGGYAIALACLNLDNAQAHINKAGPVRRTDPAGQPSSGPRRPGA